MKNKIKWITLSLLFLFGSLASQTAYQGTQHTKSQGLLTIEANPSFPKPCVPCQLELGKENDDQLEQGSERKNKKKAKTGQRFPQTGEKSGTVLWTVLGVLLIMIALGRFINKKNK